MDSFINIASPSSIMSLLSFVIQLGFIYFVYYDSISILNSPKATRRLHFLPNPLPAGRRILQAMITSLTTRLFGAPCGCQANEERYKVLQEKHNLLQQRCRDLEGENSHLHESMIQARQLFGERSTAMGDMWIEERNDFEKYQKRLQIDAERKKRAERKAAAQRHQEERARDREAYETELNHLKEDLRDYRESERFLCRLMKELQRAPGNEKQKGSAHTSSNTKNRKCDRKNPEITRLEGRIKEVMGMFQTQQMIAQRVKGQLETERCNTAELREKLHIVTSNYEGAVEAYKQYVKRQKRVVVTADGGPIGGKDVARICYWGDPRRANDYRNGTLQQRLKLPSPVTTAFPWI